MALHLLLGEGWQPLDELALPNGVDVARASLAATLDGASQEGQGHDAWEAATPPWRHMRCRGRSTITITLPRLGLGLLTQNIQVHSYLGVEDTLDTRAHHLVRRASHLLRHPSQAALAGLRVVHVKDRQGEGIIGAPEVDASAVGERRHHAERIGEDGQSRVGHPHRLVVDRLEPLHPRDVLALLAPLGICEGANRSDDVAMGLRDRHCGKGKERRQKEGCEREGTKGGRNLDLQRAVVVCGYQKDCAAK